MSDKFIMTSVLSIGLLASASVALAEEATSSTCRDLNAQVRTALEDNQQSSSRAQAVSERNTGLQFCEHGYYRVGADHLSQALKLLSNKT